MVHILDVENASLCSWSCIPTNQPCARQPDSDNNQISALVHIGSPVKCPMTLIKIQIVITIVSPERREELSGGFHVVCTN